MKIFYRLNKAPKSEEENEYFSPLNDKKKSSGNLTLSPLIDKTNLDYNCNWGTIQETDVRNAMLKEVFGPTTIKSLEYKNWSPENKLSTKEDKSSSQKTSNNLPKFEDESDYFHIDKRSEPNNIDQENQIDVGREYGLEVNNDEEDRIINHDLANNESKEELFTKSENISIDKSNPDWDNSNNSQFSPIPKVEEEDSSEKIHNSSIDKIPQKESDINKIFNNKIELKKVKTK